MAEAIKTQYIINNMLSVLKSGDHEAYMEYDERYRQAQLKHNKSGGNPNKPVDLKHN